MLVSNNSAIAPFASVSELRAGAPRGRAWVNWFCLSPFRDIDDRALYLAAGKRAAIQVARDPVMSGAPHRS